MSVIESDPDSGAKLKQCRHGGHWIRSDNAYLSPALYRCYFGHFAFIDVILDFRGSGFTGNIEC